MSKTNQICITCTQRDTCQYYDPNRTICVPVMTEQEMQFELMKSQEKVNALRQEVAEMNKEREYWQHYRIQAAIAAMQGMLANPQTFEQIDHDEGYKEVCDGDKTKIVAIASVMYADALIAELQKKGGDNGKSN